MLGLKWLTAYHSLRCACQGGQGLGAFSWQFRDHIWLYRIPISNEWGPWSYRNSSSVCLFIFSSACIVATVHLAYCERRQANVVVADISNPLLSKQAMDANSKTTQSSHLFIIAVFLYSLLDKRADYVFIVSNLTATFLCLSFLCRKNEMLLEYIVCNNHWEGKLNRPNCQVNSDI